MGKELEGSGKLLRIGITGNIATGKTEVSGILRGMGIPVVSADDMVRGMQEPGNVIWMLMREELSRDIFAEDGTLERERIVIRMIEDADFRIQLEHIIHPVVKQEIVKMFHVWELEKRDCAAAEVPLLFEAGWDDLFTNIIVTRAPRDIQISRIVDKRGIAADIAARWVDMQMGQDMKIRRADEVVDTDCDPGSLMDEMKKLIERLKEDSI